MRNDAKEKRKSILKNKEWRGKENQKSMNFRKWFPSARDPNWTDNSRPNLRIKTSNRIGILIIPIVIIWGTLLINHLRRGLLVRNRVLILKAKQVIIPIAKLVINLISIQETHLATKLCSKLGFRKTTRLLLRRQLLKRWLLRRQLLKRWLLRRRLLKRWLLKRRLLRSRGLIDDFAVIVAGRHDKCRTRTKICERLRRWLLERRLLERRLLERRLLERRSLERRLLRKRGLIDDFAVVVAGRHDQCRTRAKICERLKRRSVSSRRQALKCLGTRGRIGISWSLRILSIIGVLHL